MKNTFYDVNLQINVPKRSIDVEMTINYTILEEKTDKIEFLLYERLEIDYLEGKNIDNYQFDPQPETRKFLPEAGNLTIYLKETAHLGDQIELRLKYDGQVGILKPSGDNRLTESWVELGIYLPWFPWNIQMMETQNIMYNIDLDITEDYQVISSGKIIQEDGYWHLENDLPTIDIVIMASKDLKKKSINKNDMLLNVYYTTTENKIADYILENSWETLSIFNDWFGETCNNQISFIIAPGGSYARPTFIKLRQQSDSDYKENFEDNFRLIAHEIGHLWWLNAPVSSWEDWLNEAFAEYSARMAIRRKYGQDRFEQIMERTIERCKDLPPIRGIDRNHKDIKAVTYSKGCILLYQLENELGTADFLRLLHQISDRKISSTAQFLECISEIGGKELANEFNQKLSQ